MLRAAVLSVVTWCLTILEQLTAASLGLSPHRRQGGSLANLHLSS